MPNEKPSPSKPKPRRRWRMIRLCLLMTVLIPVLLVCLVLILGRTALMKTVVEPVLASQLGVGVQTDSITLRPDGSIVIRDAVFRSNDIDGQAGDLIEVPRATIDIDWGGIFRGGVQVTRIEIDRPTLRVSQDARTGRVNLADLRFEQSGGGGPTPAIELRDGILEIGEHDDTGYTLLKTLSMRGRIEREDADGVSSFALVALPAEAGMGNPNAPAIGGLINLNGQISPDGVTGRLDGLRLEDWPGEFVPSRSRDMYDRLALAGELAPTRLNIDADGEVEVILTLDGVSLNLPFDDSGSITGPGDLLRMRQTRGTITFGSRGLKADLNGLIDALDYDVSLDYDGLDAQSPFDAVLTTEFRLDGQFRPTKFLPEDVVSKLQRFENPVADVEARVEIGRDLGQPIRVSGRATFSNGSATYKQFRYPFEQVKGVISFEPDRLVMEDITGVGSTGAKLRAEGVFSPLGDDAEAEILINAQSVPIDETLFDALDDGQRQLVQALFSSEDYERLLNEGLLLSEQDRAKLVDQRKVVWDQLDALRNTGESDAQRRIALANQLATLDRQLSVPQFTFGGEVDVDVTLRRHPQRPDGDRWTTDVRADLPQAGLVPANFPLPVEATGVEITINEEKVELTGGNYRGTNAGTASVEALIDRTKPDAKPVVNINASGIPIDDRLVAAIPGYHAPQSNNPDDISLRRILDRMRLGGSINCDAIIGPRADGRLGFDVEATISRGFARPIYQGTDGDDDPFSVPPGSDPLALNELFGTVYVTEELIIVDLNAKLSAPELPLAPTPVSVLTQLTLPSKRPGLGSVRRENGLLPTDYGPPVPGPEIFAIARVDGLDLSMPLHHAVAVVSPRIARDLLEYDASLNPEGVLAIDARLEGFVGAGTEASFTLDRIESLGFDLDSTRYAFGASWGSATLDMSLNPSIAFDGFRVPIRTGERDSGTISLDGSLPLVRAGQLHERTDTGSMHILYEDGSINSAPVRLLIERSGSSGMADWFRDTRPDGQFDLDVTIGTQAGSVRPPPDAPALGLPPISLNGILSPRSLGLTVDEQPARFDEVSGKILFEGFSGRFDQIRLESADSSVGIDGTWQLPGASGLDMDLRVNASGNLLNGPVRAILPGPIDRVIENLELEAEQGLQIHDMRVSTRALGTPEGAYTLRGSASIEQGNAQIGLPISELNGNLDFGVRGTADTLGYELQLRAARLRAGLVRAYDANVQIIGDANNPGVVLIPEIVAGMHGGRIAGSAQIRPGSGGEPHYWMELHASGIRAAPVFDDLLLPPGGLVGPPLPGQDTVLSAWSKAEDLSRGSMLADFTLTGPIGDPQKRTGRGTIEIKGGSVLALPGLINLIEVSNLSLPTGATIDLAQADFYVDGPTLAFEQLNASSRRIEILGYGTLNWQSRAVDLRFRSRAINPIPIVSGIFESLRDELITTRVTGTIDRLDYSVSQFAETRRLLNALLGKPPSEQEQRIRQVRERVMRNQIRTRRPSSDVVHTPTQTPQDDWAWDRTRGASPGSTQDNR